MKKVFLILLICFGINSIHSGELRGKTSDSELFAKAVNYGDYYLCKSLLDDPEVDINLKEDFNDNVFRYVFDTSLNVDNFTYNSEEVYYISQERIKIFALLLSNNLSLEKVRVWDYFPVIWSPEAQEIAEIIYKLKPFKKSDLWVMRASSISEEYDDWIKEKGVEVETPDSYPKVAIQSMEGKTDTQLLEGVKDMLYYSRTAALEEVRARSVNGTFTLHEELYNHTVKLRGVSYTQYDVRKLESTLFLLNDKRIIPNLLYDSYLAVNE